MAGRTLAFGAAAVALLALFVVREATVRNPLLANKIHDPRMLYPGDRDLAGH